MDTETLWRVLLKDIRGETTRLIVTNSHSRQHVIDASLPTVNVDQTIGRILSDKLSRDDVIALLNKQSGNL